MGWGRKLGRYKDFEIKADELLTIYQHVIARSVVEYAYRDGNVLDRMGGWGLRSHVNVGCRQGGPGR